MTIRILLADDQPLLRQGFAMTLETQPDLHVVGEAADGAQAVELATTLRPDVVLMDVRMPAMDGIEATRRIVTAATTTRTLMLTVFDLDAYVYAALHAGASGFLLKNARPADLFTAIRAVAAGTAVVDPAVTRRLIETFTRHTPAPAAGQPHDGHRFPRLTDREHEVLIEIAKGRTNTEIAERLGIVPGTVKVHIGRILGKLELRDRVQLVIYAYETGLIQPGA